MGPTPPPPKDLGLDRRIAALEHRLLEEGLGPSVPPQPRSALPPACSGASPADTNNSSNNDSNSTANDQQLLPTFLSTLRSMSANVSRTPAATSTDPTGRVRSTKHRALSSLLSVIELALAETTRLTTSLTQIEAAHTTREGEWDEKEKEYRQVISELVGRGEAADKERERTGTILAEAQERVTELTDELDGCKGRLREVTAELNESLEQQQQKGEKDIGKDAATGMEEEDDAVENDNNEEEADGTLDQIRQENERLRQMVGNGEGSAASASATASTAHNAIHVELRAQAALLEEENRRLLQRLDVGGGVGGRASVSCTPSVATGAAGTPSAALLFSSPITQFGEGGGEVLQLQVQSQELQRELRDRDGRLSRAEGNLRSVLEQSRAHAAEATRLAAEGGAVRRRLDEEGRRAEAAERTVAEAERERSDVLRAYRAVVEERAQLALRVEELVAERSRMGQQLAVRQEEVQSLRNRIGHTEQELNRRARQGGEYERRLAEMAREGQSLRHSLATVESNRAMELQQAMAKDRQEIEELRRSLSVLESEKARIEAALAEERKRCEGMEQVVSTTRAKEAAASEQISKLSRETASLAMKLNEADARLEAASARSSRRGRLGAKGEALVLGDAKVNQASRADGDANGGGVPATISFSKE